MALAWISQDAHWPKKSDDMERIDSKREVTKKPLTISLNTRRSLCSTTSSSITDPEKKSPRVTDKSLAPNGALRVLLQRGEHWSMQENLKKEPRCQLHYWATSEKTSCATNELCLMQGYIMHSLLQDI